MQNVVSLNKVPVASNVNEIYVSSGQIFLDDEPLDIRNGSVFFQNKRVQDSETINFTGGIHISITGNVKEIHLREAGNVEVQGNVGEISSTSGNVKVNANNVKTAHSTSGNVYVTGDVEEARSTSGNIITSR